MKKSPVFGLKCCESLASYDVQSSSWRTYQMCFDWGDLKSLEVLPKSGMTANGQLYRLGNLEHHTSEDAGFVSLPTPTSSDYKRRGPNSKQQGLSNVENWAHLLPTPTAHTAKNNPCTPSRLSDKHQACLNSIVGKTEKSKILGKKARLSPHFVAWMMGFPIEWLD